MKLQFKEQNFQIQAVDAVVKCFEGQALKTNRFTLEKSREIIRKANNLAKGIVEFDELEKELNQDIGYRNSPIQISEDQVKKNIKNVQREHYLIENQKIDTIPRINLGLI